MNAWPNSDWDGWLESGETLRHAAVGRLMTRTMFVLVVMMVIVGRLLDMLPLILNRPGTVGFFFTGAMVIYGLGLTLADGLHRWLYAITDRRVLALTGWRFGKPRLRQLPLNGLTAKAGWRSEVFLRAQGRLRLTLRLLPRAEALRFAEHINEPEAAGANRTE